MTIYTAAITLFLVMDPLGNMPIFISALKPVEPRRRKAIIVREMLIALVILGLFLFFGQYILQGMHISRSALRISGGIILFLIAIRMIFPRSKETGSGDDREDEPFIVPLAVPLVAGPSAMTTVILFATQEPERIATWTAALAIAWFACAVILFFSDALHRILGRRLVAALERLMGMILTTMAIEMLLTGIGEFLAERVI